MIRTLAVECATILDHSKDDGETEVENPSDEKVMGAVQAFCEFSLLVSQQNHSDLSLTAPDNALKRSYQMKGTFRKQKMSKSVTAKVDDLLGKESHQVREQMIHQIRAAMEALVYGTEKVSTMKRRQLQVRLNSARQAATTWSDADHQEIIDGLECEFYQLTPAKRKIFDKLLARHERQLLQEAGTKVTGPGNNFTKTLP